MMKSMEKGDWPKKLDSVLKTKTDLISLKDKNIKINQMAGLKIANLYFIPLGSAH